MRPENEWFEPEKLQVCLYAYESIALLFALALVGLLWAVGAVAEMEQWTLWVGGGLLLVAFAYVAWWIQAFVRTAAYRFTGDEVEYRRGVFFRQKTTVPYNRITNVNASQGPVQRLLGAGSVGLHTAGYGGQTGAELTIGGVSDFEEIRDGIVAKVRGRPPRATEGGDEPPTVTEPVVGDRSTGADGTAGEELLVELRRIRELLEQGRVA